MLERCRAAVRVPFAAHCAVEGWRWVARSRLRGDGRAYRRALAAPTVARVPVLVVHGARDALVPPAQARASAALAGPEHRLVVLPRVGHHVLDEAPEPLARALVAWLGTLGPDPGLAAVPAA